MKKVVKRIVSLFLAVMMVLGVAPLTGLVGLNDIFTTTAEATSSNYTVVWSPNDLDNIRNNLSGNYILANDIDMSKFGNWEPIGSSSNPFKGTIDGNGHSIINLTVNWTTSAANGVTNHSAGFISATSGATIKNLGFENSSVSHVHTGISGSGASFGIASGIVGEAQNSTLIENCFFEGSVYSESTKYAFARSSGIALCYNSTIRNCYVDADIYSKGYSANTMIGGIAAWNDGSTIDKCYVAGTIYAESTKAYVYMGGIVGSGGGTVSNCAVLLDSIDCSGTTTYGSTSLVDIVCPVSSLSNNKALSTIISSIANRSATSITASQAKTASTYTTIGWDFDSVWKIDNGYPTLKTNDDEYKDSYNDIANIIDETKSLNQTNNYILEHINFVKFDKYNNLMNYYRFEDNLIDIDDFNNQIAAAVVWDLIGDVGEMASLNFDDLTMCDNPFSIVLADLITSYTASQTLESACYNEALDVFDTTYDNFMSAIKTSNEWNESLEPKIKIEVKGILTDPNYKIQDKESFDVLKKILKGWTSTEISEVFNLLNVANDIFDVVDTIGELDSAFTKAVNAYITASAFKNVGDNFVSTLLVVAYEMGADTFSSALFTDAILEYADLLNGESAYHYALENLAESLSWVSYDLVVKKLVQNIAYSFVSTAFGCAPSAVGVVVFAYNTTYSILDKISALGESADLLYLMDAARQIEKGLYSNTKSAATSLQNNQTLSSAELFDCRWGMLCAIQKYEYNCAAKYASKASTKTRFFRAFNANYESNDMKTATELSSCWENVKCHGNTDSFGKICSVECPTNVIVKNSSGETVLQVEENEIKKCKEGIVVLVGDEHKYFSLPNNELFGIEITGTDDGSMDYTITEMNENTIVREVQYKQIPLYENIIYNGNVSNKIYEQASKYNLNSKGENIAYLNDSVENDGYFCNDLDWDGDGLTNIEEYEFGTNPLNPDTDGDNVYDIIEIRNDTNPLESMTDGGTDDYTIIYGVPDVFIDETSFIVDETTITCTISNNTDGKAMRTHIYLYDADGELLELNEVNLDANSSVDYSFSKEHFVDGMRIVIDEEQITRDSDYSNNEFVYVPATGITASPSEVAVVKGESIQLEYALTPENASKIIEWESADETIVTVSDHGVATGVKIGTSTITATTLTGYTCTYEILVEPFAGAGLTDFDCTLINSDTEVRIIGYVGSDLSISIPEQIAGYPVTSIVEGAFTNDNIETVYIPSTVSEIQAQAFSCISNFKSITVDSANTRYCSVDGVLFNYDCTELVAYPPAIESAEYKIHDTVLTVAPYAFYQAQNLTTVDLNNVQIIEEYAFDYSALTSITIPEQVTILGKSAFYNCANLTNVYFNAINCDCSFSPNLFSFAVTTKVYHVFSETVTSVNLGKSVQSIDNGIFGLVSVTGLNIPESVKTIRTLSFRNAKNLTDIYYDGSARAWSEISIGSYSGLTDVIMHYGKFTATFICEGETVSQTDYKPGENITFPENLPDKKYYTFADWTPAVPETMPEYDMDFTAVWELSETTRTIEYYVDGELYWSDYRYAGEDVTLPDTTPTKEGYTFIKWAPDVAETMPDENLIYEAVWNTNVHQVSFIVDGETYHSYECAYSDAMAIPDDPSKEGYTFAGWTPSIPETMPDMDMTFTAVFEPITYTATFTSSGETIGTDEFIVSDESLDYPVIEEKAGYEWVWDEHEIIAGDITVNGEYILITYTATFVADGETVDTVQFNVENQTVVEPSIPQKDGYTAAWETYEITLSDFTVNVAYVPIVYTATFTSNGDEIATDEFTVEDISLDYPEIEEKQHYEWLWDEHQIAANDLTINGSYVPITYTAKFVIDGEVVKTQEFTVVDYTTVIAPEIPEKEGYTSSWQEYEGKNCNFTVNAIYTPINYIAYLYCEGNLVGTRPFTVESKQINFPKLANREGYEVVWDEYNIVASNIEINARYVPIEYTAQFVADGVVISTQTFTVETESLIEPDVPQKAGYFARWSNYELKAKDITIIAKYHLPEVVTVSKRTLDVGDTYRLLPTCNFEVTEKSWVSSDTSVATVNQHGKVTAVSKGECEITTICYGKDSLGNDIQASKVTKIIVNDVSETKDFKQSFREMFDEFFEVTLHDLLYNLREFMIVLFRYAY